MSLTAAHRLSALSTRPWLVSRSTHQWQHHLTRSYANQIPKQPPVEMLTDTARPRQYYQRPNSRPLPQPPRVWPYVLTIATVGMGAWYAFLTFVTNREKMTSSVVNQILRTVRESNEMEDLLGQAIRPEPAWYLNGDPMIQGHINQLAGNVDISFRLKGSKASGTVYFTSVRKEKGQPFTILRFRIIRDDGVIVNIDSTGTP